MSLNSFSSCQNTPAKTPHQNGVPPWHEARRTSQLFMGTGVFTGEAHPKVDLGVLTHPLSVAQPDTLLKHGLLGVHEHSPLHSSLLLVLQPVPPHLHLEVWIHHTHTHR